MSRSVRIASLVAWMCLPLAPASAAGGHFDVDDATVLDPGHCQVETWFVRAPAARATVLHLGPACRVGPVELGLNAERVESGGERHGTIGPQVKWVADPLIGTLSAGVVWAASWDVAHGGGPWQTAYVPLTWWVAETLWLHANIGADRAPSASARRRLGVSAEWAASDKVTFIAERITYGGDWTSRLGTRLSLSDSVSMEFSAARLTSGSGASRVYVIGVNRDFPR